MSFDFLYINGRQQNKCTLSIVMPFVVTETVAEKSVGYHHIRNYFAYNQVIIMCT